MNKIKTIIICFLLLTQLTSLEAQINSVSIKKVNSSFTRGQIYKHVGFSMAMNIVAVNGLAVLDSLDRAELNFPWWEYAAIASHHLPLYNLDAKKGLLYSATDLSFLGLHLASKKNKTISNIPFNLFANDELYSVYEIYKLARGRAKPGIYPEGWKTYTRKELMIAPFKKENLFKPIVGITLLATTSVAVVSALLSENTIWKTGEAYIDNKKVPIGLAVPSVAASNAIIYNATALGEEALFRGVLYEEFRTLYGPTKGKLLDMLIFPAVHVAGDIVANKSPFDIGKQFVIRSAATLLFDFAYDKGGLPASVAMHFWFNAISFTTSWLAKSGTPSFMIGYSTKF